MSRLMPPGISGSTSASIRRPEDDDRSIDETHATPARPAIARAAAMLRPSSAVDSHLDHAIADAWRNREVKPTNDGILYVGLNAESASSEVAALSRSGAAVTRIDREDGPADAPIVMLDGRPYDLSNSSKPFVEALLEKHPEVDPRCKSALVAALDSARPEGRDELAKIAMVWIRGEAGATIPSRLVVSGHHGGDGFLGSLRESDVLALARALPNAAKQIEDIHFAGCMTEGNVTLRDEMTKAFPNLRTIWGYSGYSPSAPLHHLASWERATRGHASVIQRSSVPANENAVAWSRNGGVVGKQKPLAELESDCRLADGRLDAYKAGRYLQTGLPNSDYEAYRALAQSSAATPAQRADASAKADTLLRLRKYEHVREHFANAYGARITAACAKARIAPAPDFAKMSREQAMQCLTRIQAQIVAADPSLRDALTGLVEMRSSVIPESWCE